MQGPGFRVQGGGCLGFSQEGPWLLNLAHMAEGSWRLPFTGSSETPVPNDSPVV